MSEHTDNRQAIDISKPLQLITGDGEVIPVHRVERMIRVDTERQTYFVDGDGNGRDFSLRNTAPAPTPRCVNGEGKAFVPTAAEPLRGVRLWEAKGTTNAIRVEVDGEGVGWFWRPYGGWVCGYWERNQSPELTPVEEPLSGEAIAWLADRVRDARAFATDRAAKQPTPAPTDWHRVRTKKGRDITFWNEGDSDGWFVWGQCEGARFAVEVRTGGIKESSLSAESFAELRPSDVALSDGTLARIDEFLDARTAAEVAVEEDESDGPSDPGVMHLSNGPGTACGQWKPTDWATRDTTRVTCPACNVSINRPVFGFDVARSWSVTRAGAGE